MTPRRFVWPGRRLGLAALKTQRHDASPLRSISSPLRCGQQITGRRSLASHTASSNVHSHLFSELMPPSVRPELGLLLESIRKRNMSRISWEFTAWTDILSDVNLPYHEAAIREARELPVSTFSEILRSIDPLLSPEVDIAHGLNLTQAHAQFTFPGMLLNQFGVRKVHHGILQGVRTLMEIRSQAPPSHGPTAADFEVAMRCAGAAMDYQQAKAFWTAMAAQGLQDSRTSKSWSDFIKARFMVEPVYYQFDRSRVAFLARDLYSNHNPMQMSKLKRIDDIRFSVNALKREPWNRRPDQLDEDMRRLLRGRAGYTSYKNHWIRNLYYGHEMDEELLCTSIIAFARSSSVYSIKKMILESYYGIVITNTEDGIHISGGRDFAPNSPLKPTPHLLHAIVEAFGSMSHIVLGTKLLDFISRRYDIPIPHKTWSSLLNWTYVSASKLFKRTRDIHTGNLSIASSAADVRHIWDVMTAEPYNITPTLADLDIYIKTLLNQRSFGQAIEAIRTHAIPLYTSLCNTHQTALVDEVLQLDALHSISTAHASSLTSRATFRRRKAQLLKDHAHHLISSWFARLLKSASATKARQGSLMRTRIPDLLLEFPDFFYPEIRYRTAQGHVVLRRPDTDVTHRFSWDAGSWRRTLPQKKASIYARDFEGANEPEFPWPQADSIKVLEWKRVPRKRSELARRPPGEAARESRARGWWDALEEELML
ncbi:mitochondrial ATPase expression domain-containing protein [Trichoderma barbatum]